MYCTNCGSPDQTGNFCSACGASTAPQKVDLQSLSAAQVAAANLPPLKPSFGFDYEGRFAASNSYAQYVSGPKVTLAIAVRTCFRKYFRFAGRATRSEYWFFQLFQVLVALGVIGFIMLMFSIYSLNPYQNGEWTVVTAQIAAIAFFAFMLAVFFPTLSVLIRRLHDIGQSGWMYWLSLIPFVGGVIVFILTLQPSEPYRNRYDR